MRCIIAAIAILFCAGGLSADVGGSLSGDLVARMRAEFRKTGDHTPTINAVTNNKVADLALNREKLVQHDKFFNFKLKSAGVTKRRHRNVPGAMLSRVRRKANAGKHVPSCQARRTTRTDVMPSEAVGWHGRAQRGTSGMPVIPSRSTRRSKRHGQELLGSTRCPVAARTRGSCPCHPRTRPLVRTTQGCSNVRPRSERAGAARCRIARRHGP